MTKEGETQLQLVNGSWSEGDPKECFPLSAGHYLVFCWLQGQHWLFLMELQSRRTLLPGGLLPFGQNKGISYPVSNEP